MVKDNKNKGTNLRVEAELWPTAAATFENECRRMRGRVLEPFYILK